jgi:disulfide bond formation protein DsbB
MEQRFRRPWLLAIVLAAGVALLAAAAAEAIGGAAS